MNVKKEYIILVCIILALSLYLILRDPDRTHYRLPKVPSIDKTAILKIEIAKAGTSIVLNKRDNKWYIAPKEYLADEDKVKSMLNTIGELSLTAMVSESKNYTRYELDDKKKVTVKAFSGNKLERELEIGKAASSYQHTFVKLARDHRIYHAKGNFSDKFGQTIEDLRDKAVLSFDESEIQEIRLTKGKESIILSRTQVPVEVIADQETDTKSPSPSPQKTEMLWKTVDGKEGDVTQISKLLNSLSDLSCEKYIDDRKKEDFNGPICILELKGAKDYTLSIFAKTDQDSGNYPAVSSANDYPFLLAEWKTKALVKNPAELLKQTGK